MHKKILYIIMLILLSSFTFGAFSTDRTKYYYNKTYYLTDGIEDSDIGLNGVATTSGDATVTHGWDYTVVGSDCEYTNARAYVGSNSIYCYNGDGLSAKLNNGTFTGTFGAMIYVNLSSTNDWYFAIYDGSLGDTIRIGDVGGNLVFNDAVHGWVACNSSTPSAANNGWFPIQLAFNGTTNTVRGYINGSLCTVMPIPSGADDIRFYAYANAGVLIDEFFVSNGNRPEEAPPAAGVPESPTFDPSTPVNNHHVTTNLTIKINHTAQVNYYIYVNNVSTIVNATQTGNYFYNYTTNFSIEKPYNITVSVLNTSNGLFSANVSRVFVLDVTIPTITLNPTNSFEADNTTIITSYTNNLTLNITFYDINLGEVRLNITNSTNGSIYSFYSNVGGANNSLNLTKVIDLSPWSIGAYTVVVEVGDTHTLTAINPYSLIKEKTRLKYYTEEGINIDVVCLNATVTKLDTRKLIDRYTFNTDCKEFLITSDKKLEYLPNSEYYAHFVTRNGVKGNWIDFHNKELTKSNYKIEKINDYNYKISIINLLSKDLSKEFTFESIGGLNVVTQNYKFYIGAIIDVTTYNKLSSGTKIDSNVTLQGQTVSFNASSNVPARLTNITNGTNLIIQSASFRNITRNLTLSSYLNLSYNMTPTDAITFSIYDETTGNLLEDVTFSLDFISTNDSRNLTTSLGTAAVSSLPNSFLTFRYLATDYWERFYFIQFSATSPNDITLFTINDTLGVETTATVYNQNNKLIEGVYIVAYRFDIIHNTYNLVEMCKTNFEGECVLHLQQSTEFYYFKLYTPFDTLRQTTSDTYITSNSVIFQISTSDSFGQDYEFTQTDVISSLSFNPTLNTFNYYFNDTTATITQGCLYVYLINGSFNNSYNSSCLAASSGLISLGVSIKNGSTFSATGTITLDGVELPIEYSSYTFKQALNNKNLRLFLIFLLTITFMFAFKYSLELGIIILPLPLLFASLMGFIQISRAVTISIEVAALIVAMVLNKVMD